MTTAISASSLEPMASRKRRLILFFLAPALIWFVKPSQAACTCHAEKLEIAILLDCSGSMNHMLATLQQQVGYMLEAMEGEVSELRAAAIVFRTMEYKGKQLRLDIQPFTGDRRVVTRFLQGQTAEGGGNELIKDAMRAALDKLSWSKGARKIVVILGDEQSKEDEHATCLELAQTMRERGIVLHAVTASQTAWIYWAPLHEENWKARLRDIGPEAKKVFRLPYFDALANEGRGISVSSWNSRELILWLMAFALGLNEQQVHNRIDMDKYLEWTRERERDKGTGSAMAVSDPGSGPGSVGSPLLVRLKHSGDWNVPHSLEHLLGHLEKRLALSGSGRACAMGLMDQGLSRIPIAYVTGHDAIKWNATEVDVLKKYLRGGGFLFADACCGDSRFDQSLRAHLRAIFPETTLKKLSVSHEIFFTGHSIKSVMRCQKSRTGPLLNADPELWGLEWLDPETGLKRLVVVYSPYDLGCSWHQRFMGVPCMYSDQDGTALAANVLVWALTR